MTHEEKEKFLFSVFHEPCDYNWAEKKLDELLASAEKKGREEALKAFNPYPSNPVHKGCECDVCIGRQWNEDKRHR